MGTLAVFSHKICWRSKASPSGYATDGGFPFQMRALSQVFDRTVLLVPVDDAGDRAGERPITGNGLLVAPLTKPAGSDLSRKAALPFWLIRNGALLLRAARQADAIHAPIPGDIGTFGMILAVILRKPLFVRYCGNWDLRRTRAERFWRWFMERFAGGRNVMLATGGSDDPPSHDSPEIRWIFSSSLTEAEIVACGRLRESLPGPAPKLIIVSRQERSKGTAELIECLPLLTGEFPGISLDVVGEGRALQEFRSLAERMGAQVRFHGSVSHDRVIELLCAADLFCFPTASEGFPKAVLEALACGLPVISTRVSVLPRLIASAGVIIDDVSPRSIAEAIRDCLSNEEKYRGMSRAALDVARGYSLEAWRDEIGRHLRRAGFPVND